MRRIYLVQEGKFKETPYSEIIGLDSLIDFRYMGAAEFEYGALPTSLKRIVKNSGTYLMETLKYHDQNGNPMFLYHNMNAPNQGEELYELIEQLIAGKIYCKRPINIKRYIQNSDSKDVHLMNFWWDIENDFFLFLGHENQEKVLLAIEQLKLKWKDELFPKKLTYVERISDFIYRITHNGHSKLQ